HTAVVVVPYGDAGVGRLQYGNPPRPAYLGVRDQRHGYVGLFEPDDQQPHLMALHHDGARTAVSVCAWYVHAGRGPVGFAVFQCMDSIFASRRAALAGHAILDPRAEP